MKRGLSILLSLTILVILITIPTVHSYASYGNWKLTINSVFEGCEADYTISNTQNSKLGYELLYMQSSDPSIVKITEYEQSSYSVYEVNALKPGKAIVTARIIDDNNYIYEIPCTVTVKKYPNQIKSLKINGKSVKIKGNKRFSCTKVTKKNKAKIKIALKKGWKITKVKGKYLNIKTGKSTKIKGIKKAIVKGKPFKFPKKYYVADITITMKKGKQTMKYSISLVRGIIDY